MCFKPTNKMMIHANTRACTLRLTRERGMELVPTPWTTGKLAREV